ncbi:MAG: hypothetical protein C9356_20310 [Oleiphilus sp.]|nr:MAG: hypothetical protein C9356_20310 [Oleiphilus sp.]
MKKLLKVALISSIGIGSANTFAFDCNELLQEKKPLPESMEGLEHAVSFYSLSNSIGKCLYPKVQVSSIPVGEYESYSSDGPEILTLSNRLVYRWGDHELQTAVVVPPNNMKLEVSDNGTGLLITSKSSVSSDTKALERISQYYSDVAEDK